MSESLEREFEVELDSAIEELRSCQEGKSVSSCFVCEKVLGCELRGRYVKAVYFSMSKGEAGDFEF